VALTSSKRVVALLAGRKLLLADDSATIQKVIELTFTDEGVHVVSVNNGNEAIERLDEVSPDIVLADVFMPGMTGYEVCDYIKHCEKLSHIPVMLLVGSFEPFDEEEARRVGADDIVSKPFQSIRKLIDKVSTLLGGRPVEEKLTTLEFPPEEEAEDIGKMSSVALETSTADTLPLPDETDASTEQTPQPSVDNTMETYPARDLSTRTATDIDDLLLDLGDLEPALAVAAEDSILDIDLEPPMPALSTVESRTYVEPEVSQYAQPQRVAEPQFATEASVELVGSERRFPAATVRGDLVGRGPQEEVAEVEQGAAYGEPAAIEYGMIEAATRAASSGKIGLDQLSPELIDAIARRAVERLSERVIQEIAWEVVPQLAELMITRQLEEGKSQTK
jgi:CheY-like chemotaxis protein